MVILLAIRDQAKATSYHLRLDGGRLALVNDPILVRELVRAGSGVSFVRGLYCRAAIADGSLVHIYPDLHIEQESSLSLLYPGRRLVLRLRRLPLGVARRASRWPLHLALWA